MKGGTDSTDITERLLRRRITELEAICDNLIAVIEACMPLLSVLTEAPEIRRAQEALKRKGRGPPT